jgi:hypothetical protein
MNFLLYLSYYIFSSFILDYSLYESLLLSFFLLSLSTHSWCTPPLDQMIVEMLKSGLYLHAHTSNARVNYHTSETISLNRIDVSIHTLMVRLDRSANYLDTCFKNGLVDNHPQHESMCGKLENHGSINAWPNIRSQ